MSTRPQIQHALDDEVASSGALLTEIARSLFEQPEPGFGEFNATARLTGALSAAGYAIEAPLADLPTAFRASLGHGDPAIGIFLHYDAHPVNGHLAGNHLAAAASIVALRALAAIADGLPGRIVAVGSPASEPDALGAGGKEILLEAGALDDLQSALCLVASNVHRPRLTSSPAGRLIELRFTGKASHASSAPERGINALEAALGTFSLVNALRQHLPIGSRIDGVIPNGGAAPNIVPERAVARFWLRAPGPVSLRRVGRRLLRSAEASAAAAGATVESDDRSRTYLNLIDCPPIGDAVAGEWDRLAVGGATGAWALPYPTDFGNVSQVIPSALLPFWVSDAPPKSAKFATDAAVATGPALTGARLLATSVATLLLEPEHIATGAADLAARQDRMRAFAAAAGEF
ncbi:MAG: peptidase dimerization domain-containing protein [Dehalococcoidia bacterium]